MPSGQLTTAVQQLRELARRHDAAAVSDGELLGRFVRDREDAAFAELVHRHGPMVLGVCRRVLGHVQDAEDAFQATFLVLVKRAATVQPAEQVGHWLYGVAQRTALEARGIALRRRALEAKVTMLSQPPKEDGLAELRSLLDQELSRLPEKYRIPIVLCDLEGVARKDAAQRLGWAEGTVASRLARGRNLLAQRLSSHGKPVTAGIVLAALATDVASGVPAALSNATIRAGTLVAAGAAVNGGVVPAKVAALVEGVTKMMLLTQLKATTALLVGLVIVVAVFAGLTVPAAATGEPATSAAKRGAAAAGDKKTGAAGDDGEQINAIWITDPRVQKELRLTEGQIKKLVAVRSAVYRKHEAELKKAREEAMKSNYAQYRELSRKIQAEERKALTQEAPKILSAGAIKRVRQIQWQARGLHHVIAMPLVQKRLKLDDEQVKKIEAFLKKGQEQALKDARKAFTGPVLHALTFDEHIVREQRSYAEAMKDVLGVLTAQQRRTWTELVGEPFPFKAAK